MSETIAASGHFVQSLSRGLAVIRALNGPEPMTLSDVARASELSRATSRRFVLTLERLGYVQQSGGRFALTPRVLELGFAYLSALGLPDVVQPGGSSSRFASPRRSRCSMASRWSMSPACRRAGS
jgi:IclR family pca regulon transcriptional regulator